MINIKRTKSATYFLPLFDSFFKIKYFNLLKNTYFFFDDIKEDTFSILYRFDGKVTGKYQNRQGFTIYEQQIRAGEFYISEEDYEEHVLYTFRIPDELIEVKHKLLEGKYSELTGEQKDKIILFIHNNHGPIGARKVSDVLHKSSKLKEQLEETLKHTLSKNAELSSILNVEDEIFINSLKKRE